MYATTHPDRSASARDLHRRPHARLALGLAVTALVVGCSSSTPDEPDPCLEAMIDADAAASSPTGAASDTGSDAASGVEPHIVRVVGESGRVVSVDRIFSERAFAWQGGEEPRSFDREMPICVLVRDSQDITVDVGDVFADNVLAWARGRVSVADADTGNAVGLAELASEDGAANETSFRLRMPVGIVVENSDRIAVSVQDLFGDNVVAWAQGDIDVSNLGDGASTAPSDRFALPGATFTLEVPLSIRVSTSGMITVGVEDVVGDNIVAWSEEGATLSNLESTGVAGLGIAYAPGDLDISAPVDVGVSGSDNVQIDLENVLGNGVLAWTRGDADVSNLETGGDASGFGHRARLHAPVTVRADDSRDVRVNVEDIVGDTVVGSAEADGRLANLIGSPAPTALSGARISIESGLSVIVEGASEAVTIDVEDLIGDVLPSHAGSDAMFSNQSDGSGHGGIAPPLGLLEVHAPVDLDVRDASAVAINLEDVFGDNVLASTDADAELSNLGGRWPGAPRADRLSVELPLRVNVQRSQSVRVDIEDVFGDVVVAGTGGGAVISNLEHEVGAEESVPQSLVNVPVELFVIDSDDVSVDLEDVVGDAVFAATERTLCTSNLEQPSDGAGPAGFVASVPLNVDVRRSRRVAANVADVFGDNLLFFGGQALDPRTVIVDVPVNLRAVESSGVDVRIASVLSGNRFGLGGADDTERAFAEPGRFGLPGGALVLHVPVTRDIVDSDAVMFEIDRVFADNAAEPAGGDRLSLAEGADACPEPTPPMAVYLGHAHGDDAFSIDIVAGPGLARDGRALAAVERAADRWETAIDDPIAVTLVVDLSAWVPGGVIAQARVPRFEIEYALARGALVADAGDELHGADGFDDALTAALPERFDATLPGRVALAQRIAMTAAAAKAAGFEDPNRERPDATILLNARVRFDVDGADGVAPGRHDLESVALHEIGHALGFTSAVDDIARGSIRVAPTALDLYRFEARGGTDAMTPDAFRSAPRSLHPLRNAHLDFLRGSFPVESGGRASGDPDGAGYQARHWRLPSGGAGPIGAMGPLLEPGRTLSLSCADLRALDLVGYDIDGCQ